MVKKKLVEALITDGARLLRELDRQGFPVEAMFWVNLPDVDYWRLVIASPIVAEQGGLAGYRRLNGLLEEIPLAGVTFGDVSLLDPESEQYHSLHALARASSPLAAGAEWIELDEAVVYRWTPASVTGQLTGEISLSELQRLWEAERKLPNQPALLITLDRGRVTLRPHPRQGPLDGIEDVKLHFATALHRPGARPDCQVRWLS